MNELRTFLNSHVSELMFKHELLSERASETFLWLTLYPETTNLTPRTMGQILQVESALCEHAKAFWGWSEELVGQIELTKIDSAIDLKGSFIPNNRKPVYKEIKMRLEQAMTKVFSDQSMNFLSLHKIGDFRVVNGDNNLETCYQYAICNESNEKLLNIKFYDKMLDLIGRDGIKMVGTRLDHILGCKG